MVPNLWDILNSPTPLGIISTEWELTILVELNVVDIGLADEEVDPRISSNESCENRLFDINKKPTKNNLMYIYLFQVNYKYSFMEVKVSMSYLDDEKYSV